MIIHPIKLFGNWNDGWALDKHTISSEYIGEDPFGHPHYNTTRSEIGELMYQLKYQRDYRALPQIVDTLVNFLINNRVILNIDIILPVPPSKRRMHQPVFSIAEAAAKRLKVFYADDALIKTSSGQAKDMSVEEKSSLINSVSFTKTLVRPCNILLLDDIFKSGSTLKECVRALRTDSNVKNIYVVTMTKTKGG